MIMILFVCVNLNAVAFSLPGGKSTIYSPRRDGVDFTTGLCAHQGPS